MTTDEERREAAALLREYANYDFGDSDPWQYAMKAAFGDVAPHGEAETFARLADLIEPEPERVACVKRDMLDEAQRDRYREAALSAACRARIAGGAPCTREGCRDRHGWCAAVIEEVEYD